MNTKFFTDNRKKIADKLSENSVLLLFAGTAPYKRGDELYRFTPDRNFYYVTGIDRENIILLIHKDADKVTETLFIERSNGHLAKWVGAKMSKQEAQSISSIKDIRYIDEFEKDLSSIVFSFRVKKIYLDLERREWNINHSPAINFAKQFAVKYPYVPIDNIYYEFSKLRLIKTKEEIECIRKAISITKEGIELMLRHAKPEMMEYEIEAYFDFVMTKNGVKDKAFNTIAASGKNGTILHYSQNNCKTKDNDLLLCDLGAQYEYYSADITRTFPVNGKFTQRQKQIYNIVLEGQKIVIDTMKAGVPFTEPNNKLKQYYCEQLKSIGLIKEDKELEKYYYHSVSHSLGLETHDIGRNNEGNLKSGMVITAEPGLYIEEEGIGIRIEDDILITDDGNEILSKDIIKSVDEIENFMSK